MKLLSLEFEDKQTGWKLERMEFNPDMNLLVGVSGVGKTKILEAIETVGAIYVGTPSKACAFRVSLTNENGDIYEWEADIGRFEKDLSLGNVYLQESITLNGRKILDRTSQDFKLMEKDTANPSSKLSGLGIYGNMPEFAKIVEFFSNIVSNRDQSFPFRFAMNSVGLQRYTKTALSFEELIKSNIAERSKVIIANYLFPKEFKNVNALFCDAFNSVETLMVVERSDFLDDYHALGLKERGVPKEIMHEDWSSGMKRTLHYINSVLLYDDKSLMLMDEFEQSLGLNCIDLVTDLVNTQSAKRQFILTSHHPYIINNISNTKWKIITRKGSVVTSHNAQDLQIGKSHHEAFMQLINSEEYAEGISA